MDRVLMVAEVCHMGRSAPLRCVSVLRVCVCLWESLVSWEVSLCYRAILPPVVLMEVSRGYGGVPMLQGKCMLSGQL